MPKLRGQRHSWDRESEWATCANCGLRVETRLIRKGGLPTCDEVVESKSQEITQPVVEAKSQEITQPVVESKPQEISKPGKPKFYFQEYIDYYHKGCDRFGVWKLFTFSMLAFSAVFIAVAIILVVLYL